MDASRLQGDFVPRPEPAVAGLLKDQPPDVDLGGRVVGDDALLEEPAQLRWWSVLVGAEVADGTQVLEHACDAAGAEGDSAAMAAVALADGADAGKEAGQTRASITRSTDSKPAGVRSEDLLRRFEELPEGP